MSGDLIRYCKQSGCDISIFAGYEDLAEKTLLLQKIKGSSKKQITKFREVLGWYINEDLRRIALLDIAAGNLVVIAKTTAVKIYGKALVAQCPWCLLADNPHYKTSSPMQLYFPSLLNEIKARQIAKVCDET
ncbi:hypothetical protein [Ferrovum myxofaciens]|uniref:hypothetical protein n=1 Tax=Ferrovum myxofaciens TaxID=416213 RepID=UPI003EBA4B13